MLQKPSYSRWFRIVLLYWRSHLLFCCQSQQLFVVSFLLLLLRYYCCCRFTLILMLPFSVPCQWWFCLVGLLSLLLLLLLLLLRLLQRHCCCCLCVREAVASFDGEWKHSVYAQISPMNSISHFTFACTAETQTMKSQLDRSVANQACPQISSPLARPQNCSLKEKVPDRWKL